MIGSVVLCPGHGDREPGRTWDPGAVHGTLQERALTGRVCELGEPILRAAGAEVLVHDGPGYAREHDTAVAWLDARPGPGLYCSVHANIGGGDYVLVRPDFRSQAGRRAAAAIGDSLEDLPEVRAFRTDELYPSASEASRAHRRPVAGSWEWWTRGWVCISGLWEAQRAPGVLVELGFLDSRAHAALWTDEGLLRVADRLAAGVTSYLAAEAARRAA